MKLYNYLQLFFVLFPFLSFSIQATNLIPSLFSSQSLDLAPEPSPKLLIPSISPSPSSDLASEAFSIPKSYISSTPDDASPSPSPSSRDHVNVALESRLRTAARDAKLAIITSTKLLKNPATTPKIRSCLRQCVENYGTTMDDFVNAIKDLQANDFYMLSEDLSSIEDDITACQDCFSELVGGASPMKEYEDSITAGASDSLALLEYTS